MLAWLGVLSRRPAVLARQNGRMAGDDAPTPDWTANHFSQSNPRGPGQDDVPALLRRVAETIARLGDAWIIDLVMHNEITAEGNWPSIVVYYEKEPSRS
jgi:hypothetical protein